MGLKAWLKNNNIVGSFAGGSIGLLGLTGFCGAACSGLAFPLAAFLASIGLGTLSIWLPMFKIPLLILAAFFSFVVIRNVNRQGKPLKSSLVGLAVGGLLVVSSVFAFKQTNCVDPKVVEAEYRALPPLLKTEIKTIYLLWPELGRAPTIEEIHQEVRKIDGFSSLGAEDIRANLKENRPGIFYKDSDRIKWLWPFASDNLGVIVTIDGKKPAYARCAIDALGISAMFGKPITIAAKSALLQSDLVIRIDGNKILEGDSSETIVSGGPSCDEMLFFANQDEFETYKAKMNKPDLGGLTLKEGLSHGIDSFGWRLTI